MLTGNRGIFAHYNWFSSVPDNCVLAKTPFSFQGFRYGLLQSIQQKLPFFGWNFFLMFGYCAPF